MARRISLKEPPPNHKHRESDEEGLENESHSSATPMDDRIRAIGALLFANLGGEATIQQTGQSELGISIPDGPIFTIKLDDHRVTLGGAPHSPNLDQFLGSFEEEESELRSISAITENALHLIHEAMETEGPPAPVFFKGHAPEKEEPSLPEDENNSEIGDLMTAPGSEPPLDQINPPGAQPPLPPQTPPTNAPIPGAPTMGQPPAPPMGAPPTGQPPAPPMMPPSASRRSSSSVVAAMDNLAGELEKAGFKREAARVDKLTNTVETRLAKATNPWAVCTDSVGRKDKAKYERCVKKVKKKSSVNNRKARPTLRPGDKFDSQDGPGIIVKVEIDQAGNYVYMVKVNGNVRKYFPNGERL